MNRTFVRTITQSLTAHKARTFLTLLGMIVSVMAIVVVVTIGQGIARYVSDQVGSFGAQSIQVEVKVPSTDQLSNSNYSSQALGVQITTLTLDDAAAVSKLPGVAATTVGLITQQKTRAGNKDTQALILGTTAQQLQVDRNVKIAQGAFFTPADDAAHAQVAVLGSAIKEELFGAFTDAVGKRIKIGRNRYRVVGVLRERGATFGFSWDDVIYLPVTTVQKKLMGVDYVQYITVRAADGTDPQTVADDITALLRIRHGTHGPDDDFGAATIQEVQDTMSSVLKSVNILLLLLASISLLVGGVGIMNVMLVAVQERVREIGLRRALGARAQDIRAQFLAEAVVIALIGALIGIVLGATLVLAATVAVHSRGMDVPVTLSAIGPLIGIGFALIAGVVFGSYPALRAARITPIEALRR